MRIDPRLPQIDDALYRVAARALIIQNNKVLAVKEFDSGSRWAIPGGGVDYGETLKECLLREIHEEMGVPNSSVTSDFNIFYHTIGTIVDGIPRMNIFFKVSVPEGEIAKTAHIEKWGWFTKEEFKALDMNSSYNKDELAEIIFT